MIVRHGDVVLKSVDNSTLPKGKETVAKMVVLAEGEQTGHAHRLSCDTGNIKLLETEMARYIVLSDTCQLNHEEHGCLSIEPNTYEIVIEREHDYIEKQNRKVVD